MSQELLLVTRERPATAAFLDAVHEAADDTQATVDGDFGNQNGYLNVSGPGLLIEIEPPGHVDAADLYDEGDQVTLPEPDDDGSLWLTVASIPAAAPSGSAEVAWRVFRDLASRYDGAAIDPSAR